MLKITLLLKIFLILFLFESVVLNGQEYKTVNCNDKLPDAGWQRVRQLFYCPTNFPDYTMVMMHRGLWTDVPENSLAAVKNAIAFSDAEPNRPGFIELDIMKGANGVLFCFHDFYLDRLTTGSGQIKDGQKNIYKTYDEIKGYNLKREGVIFENEHIPTLADALELIKQSSSLMVNLDKVEDYLPTAIDLVIKKGMQERVITKGAWAKHKTPDELLASLGSYAHKDLVLKIYTPIIYENNVEDDEVTKDIIDQWLAIDGFPGFQINYKTYNSDVFTKNNFDGMNLIDYLKSRNVRIGIFSDWPDNCQGTWATATTGYSNTAATTKDRRGEWEYVNEHGANFIISDGAGPLLNFLEVAGKRIAD